jgi:hypothetical protein
MPKYSVTIGEERLYHCDVMIDAANADEAMEKVKAAIKKDCSDFPTGRRYATSDETIKCIDHELVFTFGIEVINAYKVDPQKANEIEAEIEAEGGWIT